LWPSYKEESPLGNWVADLLRTAVPEADFAIYNGGGLRAELLPGALTFGAFYEVVPFDNRLAIINLRGSTLRELLRANYTGEGHGILSISGLHASLRCRKDAALPELVLSAANGAPVRDDANYRIVTTDFLATGGDGFARRLEQIRTGVRILWE